MGNIGSLTNTEYGDEAVLMEQEQARDQSWIWAYIQSLKGNNSQNHMVILNNDYGNVNRQSQVLVDHLLVVVLTWASASTLETRAHWVNPNPNEELIMNQDVDNGKIAFVFKGGNFPLGTIEESTNAFMDMDQYIMDINTNYFKHTNMQDTTL